MTYAIVSISDTGSDEKNVRENKFNKKREQGSSGRNSRNITYIRYNIISVSINYTFAY